MLVAARHGGASEACIRALRDYARVGVHARLQHIDGLLERSWLDDSKRLAAAYARALLLDIELNVRLSNDTF